MKDNNLNILHIIITIAFLFHTAQGIDPEIPLCPSNSSQDGACFCENLSSSPWGTRIIRVDCQLKNFTITTFNWEILPPLIETLDISWNFFKYVPDLESSLLKRLVVSHNNITALDDDNFGRVTDLRELDLSWNSIEVISINAFSGLKLLKKLDISHNHLKKISFNIFSFLVSIEDLNLSWNENLNETFAVKDVDLFLGLGVTPKLKTLKLGYCGLSSLDIIHGTNLTNVHLEWNNFTSIPDMPRGVQHLDISGNPIEKMGPQFLPKMYQLQTLLMEDMPQLREIDAFTLHGLPSLINLSFQNSRQLQKLSPEAFGYSAFQNETNALKNLNLRGAPLETLNASLALVFKNLKTIDLTGLPLDCDCRIVWIKHLDIETGAQCNDPKILRGIRVSQMDFNESECKQWPGWIAQTMHGVMLVALLMICTVGLYMLVVRLRPFNHSTLRKVGPTSPYAPITIEPNRAENHF